MKVLAAIGVIVIVLAFAGAWAKPPISTLLKGVLLPIVGCFMMFGAVGAFIATPIFALIGWRNRYELRTMQRARMTCAQARRINTWLWRPRCAVSGEIVAGPSGLLTAPLSRERCVWFQVWWKGTAATANTASAPFGVRDATGTVLVDADLLRAQQIEWGDAPPPQGNRGRGRGAGRTKQGSRFRAAPVRAAARWSDD